MSRFERNSVNGSNQYLGSLSETRTAGLPYLAKCLVKNWIVLLAVWSGHNRTSGKPESNDFNLLNAMVHSLLHSNLVCLDVQVKCWSGLAWLARCGENSIEVPDGSKETADVSDQPWDRHISDCIEALGVMLDAGARYQMSLE
uniref:Uncharacterized protein n=1 Tax=Romanomermis culicivorax TaxID=13658 RepID=A0A915I5F8_ROMCU